MKAKYYYYSIVAIFSLVIIYLGYVSIGLRPIEMDEESYLFLILNALIAGMYMSAIGIVSQSNKMKYTILVIAFLFFLFNVTGIHFVFKVWFLQGVFDSAGPEGIDFFTNNALFFLSLYLASFGGESDA